MGPGAVRRVGMGVAAVAVGIGLVAGCGGDDGGGDGGGAAAEAAETADTVCSMLRDWNNDLGTVINATSQAITDQDDPATANDVLVSGFDETIRLAEQHRREVDELDLPDVSGRDDLLTELAEGADESIAVLREERAEAAELGPITLDGQAAALGGAFTGVERALSVVEPRIGAYDDELRQAFADDEGCRHVVQPSGGAER